MRTMKMEITFMEKELNTDGKAEGIYSTASVQWDTIGHFGYPEEQGASRAGGAAALGILRRI